MSARTEPLESLAARIVAEHPLAWEADLLLLGIKRAPGVSPNDVLAAIRRARTAAQGTYERALLAAVTARK